MGAQPPYLLIGSCSIALVTEATRVSLFRVVTAQRTLYQRLEYTVLTQGTNRIVVEGRAIMGWLMTFFQRCRLPDLKRFKMSLRGRLFHHPVTVKHIIVCVAVRFIFNVLGQTA